MSELCKWCAYECSDCKGNKNLKYTQHCDYYKKPQVFNAKQAAEQIQQLQTVLDATEDRYFSLLGKTMWRPIKEQPVNTADHVLVTVKWYDDDCEVMELDYGVTKHYAENGDDERHKNWCKAIVEHVIAWMPLPKPYCGAKMGSDT